MFSKVFKMEDQLWNKTENFESRIIAYGPETMMMDWHFYHAGYELPWHDHYHTQMSYVVKGSAIFVLADHSQTVLHAGESVYFAPGEAHSVVILEDDTYVMDVFAPLRLDHLEKHQKAEMDMPAEGTSAAEAFAKTAAPAPEMDEDTKALQENIEWMEDALSSAQTLPQMYGDGAQTWWSEDLIKAYSNLRGGQRAIFEAVSEYELPEGSGFNDIPLELWNEQLAVPMNEETYRALQLFEREKKAQAK